MTEIFIIMAVSLISLLSPSDGSADERKIQGLWKEYETAINADRPAKAISVLEKIKPAALASRSDWDYYDACVKYSRLGARRNWKQADSLAKNMEREIGEYGSPVVIFHHKNNFKRESLEDLYSYVEANAKQLKGSCTPKFHENDSYLGGGRLYVLKDLLLETIHSDYEYALWAIVCRAGMDEEKMPVAEVALRELIGEDYPSKAFLDLLCSTSLEKFAREWKDSAVSLVARSEILKERFGKLSSQASSQEKYIGLRNDCKTFETDRASFRNGVEKKIAKACTYVESLAEILDSKDISASVKDGEAAVVLRNIGSFSLQIKDSQGRTVHSGKHSNPKASYYVNDTVRVRLPDIDDGDYDLEVGGGGEKHVRTYEKHTLSMAHRRDGDGVAIYLADYMSGEPVAKADLFLYSGDKLVAEAKACSLDGFTRLPDAIAEKLEGRAEKQLQCSYTDASGRLHSSFRHAIWGKGSVARNARSHKVTSAVIIKDCSAFNPGETLNFKVIAYKGDMYKSLSTFASGETLTVELRDASGELVETKTLKTGEFGSASGSFLLPKGRRNGMWTLSVGNEKGTLRSGSLRVDEFVLPTYALSFDEMDELCFPGDMVRLGGKLKAYSGHALAAAKASYEIDGDGRWHELELAGDGSFAIDVPTEDEYWVGKTVTVRIVDATGETKEYSTYFHLARDLQLSARLKNAAEGTFVESGEEDRTLSSILDADKAIVELNVGRMTGLGSSRVYYKVLKEGRTVLPLTPAEALTEVNLAGMASGLYDIVFQAAAMDQRGNVHEKEARLSVLKMSDGDKVMDAFLENAFKVLKDEDVAIQIAAASGKVWAVAELFDDRCRLVDRRNLVLEGERGKEGSIEILRFRRSGDWTASMRVCVVYFRNGKEYRFTHAYEFPAESLELPLEFISFPDSVRPRQDCRLSLRTAPGTECAVAVFDVSTEKIMQNRWESLSLYPMSAPYVDYSFRPGADGSDSFRLYYDGIMTRGSKMMKSIAPGNMLYADAAVEPEGADVSMDSVEESAVDLDFVRENFDNVLSFQPGLRPDASGRLDVSFKAADKLSTYLVAVYVHDRKMHNATVRRELLVSMPIKLALVEPGLLYAGDSYVANATVSSKLSEPVAGELSFELRDADGVALESGSQKVEIPAEGACKASFPLKLTADMAGRELSLILAFKADGDKSFADRMSVKLPVHKACQILTEAHSAVLLPGDDREALEASLRERFVLCNGAEAELAEISVMDMVRAAVPERFEPSSKDVLSLSDALYARSLARLLGSAAEIDETIVGQMLACRNEDGGFAWFEGMKSSPVLTAVVLDRMAGLRERGVLPDLMEPILPYAVKYLDKAFLGSQRELPYWCGGVSLAQYLSVRARYAEVEMAVIPDKETRRRIREYLTPSKSEGRGLQGELFAKARRCGTLLELSGSEDGIALAKALGLRLGASGRVSRSLFADISSLLEYAVKHDSGGIYYPNLVMPFRGLLESEAYAHSLLCDLLERVPDESGECRRTADGIRLWLMLQKETQEWGDDPAYLRAIASVMDGSQGLEDTKVLVLKASYEKPFDEVKATGNGMGIAAKYYRGTVSDSALVREGDKISVGDKLIAVYEIWNGENRSFVRVSAPRHACLSPVNQLSGHYGWWMRPLVCDGWYGFSPQGYREVLREKTVYWFDSYPEENTSLTEEFFVTQEGEFHAPAVVVESLYAPHYRANGATAMPLVVLSK